MPEISASGLTKCNPLSLSLSLPLSRSPSLSLSLFSVLACAKVFTLLLSPAINLSRDDDETRLFSHLPLLFFFTCSEAVRPTADTEQVGGREGQKEFCVLCFCREYGSTVYRVKDKTYRSCSYKVCRRESPVYKHFLSMRCRICLFACCLTAVKVE